MSDNFSDFNMLLLNIGFAKHNADWNWKDVVSPFTRLYLVREGHAKIVLADRKVFLKPDHLYLIPAFVKHSYECEQFFSLNYIHIYETNAFRNFTDRYTFPDEVYAQDLDKQLIGRLMRINPERELKGYDPQQYDNSEFLFENISVSEDAKLAIKLETKGILSQLFSRFLVEATPRKSMVDPRIARVIEYVMGNITKSVRLEELAEIAYVSPDHLIRLFKREMNCTPIQYINNRKIENAQVQLLLKDNSVKEIAYSLDFESVSYFSKLFKSISGLAPAEYRNSVRAKSYES